MCSTIYRMDEYEMHGRLGLMESDVEFPDESCADSSTVGQLFKKASYKPTCADIEEDKRREFMRPKGTGPDLSIPTRILTEKPTIRPWTADPKHSKAPTHIHKKLARSCLRKPHLKPPRPEEKDDPVTEPVATSPVSSQSSEAVNYLQMTDFNKTSTPEPDSRAKSAGARYSESLENCEAISSDSDSDRSYTSEACLRRRELIKRKGHSRVSFESWVDGSPHGSDEYDTDIDTSEFQKGNEDRLFERSIDATGIIRYVDQCEVEGIVPVSYLVRHLGDRTLKMRHHYLGPAGTRALSIALSQNTVTELVDLEDNYLDVQGIGFIGGMLKINAFIVNLNIANNFIGNEGFKSICTMLECNTVLKTLCVAGNQLTEAAAQYLVEGLKNNSSLLHLDLSSNNFGDKAGVYLGEALKVNEGLTDLDLRWNSITGRGAGAFLKCLTVNECLEVLDLSWNGIGLYGCLALKPALRDNNTLKVLDLSRNRIRDVDAALALAIGIKKNHGLETLALSMNPLRDESIEKILKGVKLTEGPLSLLMLEEIHLNQANLMKIQELKHVREDFTVLHGGTGGHDRYSLEVSMMNVFSKFLLDHQTILASVCPHYDHDCTGHLQIEDVKVTFKEAGLKLTNKQLDLIVDALNITNASKIKYNDILNGKAVQDYLRQCPYTSCSLKSSKMNLLNLPNKLSMFKIFTPELNNLK